MRTGDTDFMRIRRYVVDRIATNGDQPIRFPATRELARQFGVSQPTALRAIQSLIEEGYLIACKSGGTISRPATLGYSENLKIFGLVEYQGKQVFDTLYFNLISHAVSYELLRRSETNKTKQLILETPSQLERTAREENLSGVILLGSEPHMPNTRTICGRTAHRLPPSCTVLTGSPASTIPFRIRSVRL